MLSQIYTGKIYPHVLIMDSSISFLWNSISVFTLHCVAINTCCRKKSRSCLLVKSMIFCLKIRKKVGNLILYLIYTCFVCISDKKMLCNLTNISSTPDKGQSQTNKRVDECGLFHYESYILGCQNDSWQTRIYHFRLPKDRFSSWKCIFFIIKLLCIQDCHLSSVSLLFSLSGFLPRFHMMLLFMHTVSSCGAREMYLCNLYWKCKHPRTMCCGWGISEQTHENLVYTGATK